MSPTTTAAAGIGTFRRLLVNTLLASLTTSYLWFALTFWVYLETRSVMTTSIVSGMYMLILTATGTFFGAYVDRHRKKDAMVLSSTVTLTAYVVAGTIFVTVPAERLVDWSGPWFWAFSGLVLVGGVVGQLRGIALSTAVTLLVPEERRDKANGLVGMMHGLAHVVTGVVSGISVGLLGMGGTVAVSIVITAIALAHLLPIRIPERLPARTGGGSGGHDVRVAFRAIRAVPGLFPLIGFTTFNNLAMGVFMALCDPYGLTLFSVEAWGIVLGVTGVGFIAGGAAVARFGLGRRPLRTLLLANGAIATIGMGFAVRESPVLLVVGFLGFFLVMPVAEAAEQTILQRVVPYEKQGRVFGVAQSMESASTPVSAFVIGPLAQLVIIPFMETAGGRRAFGWLLGDGDARGIALTFVTASAITLVAVLLAFSSRAYRRLSGSYAEGRVGLDTASLIPREAGSTTEGSCSTTGGAGSTDVELAAA